MTAISQVRARVISNTSVMPGVFQLQLDCPAVVEAVKPGQFVMVKCGKNHLLRRPISVSSIDVEKGLLSLLIMRAGKIRGVMTGTMWLGECQQDDKIDILGPLGNGFTINPTAKNLLLIAGGMGIAPLIFLAEEAQKSGCHVKMQQGVKTKVHVCRDSLLPARASMTFITEDGSAGRKGMVTECLPELSSRADQVFACGPTAMYRALALKRQELPGTKPVQISLEVRMACGLGVCYGCAVKTKKGLKQVCRDGPVFELDDILWDEFVDV